MTCGDKEAQDDCKSKGGICEDKADLKNGYKCNIKSSYKLITKGCVE